jgi:hypothetical protein
VKPHADRTPRTPTAAEAADFEKAIPPNPAPR